MAKSQNPVALVVRKNGEQGLNLYFASAVNPRRQDRQIEGERRRLQSNLWGEGE